MCMHGKLAARGDEPSHTYTFIRKFTNKFQIKCNNKCYLELRFKCAGEEASQLVDRVAAYSLVMCTSSCGKGKEMPAAAGSSA